MSQEPTPEEAAADLTTAAETTAAETAAAETATDETAADETAPAEAPRPTTDRGLRPPDPLRGDHNASRPGFRSPANKNAKAVRKKRAKRNKKKR